MALITEYKVYENKCAKSLYTTTSIYDAEEFVRRKRLQYIWEQNPYRDVFEIIAIKRDKEDREKIWS